MKVWDKTKALCRELLERVSPWKHLGYFLLILSVTTLLKYGAAEMDWIAPRLAAWELAALVHVFLVVIRNEMTQI